ncbi:MAG: serine/threonine protein kinase [Saprospiraceae bacterium]|nr:serine/threonine protein kinase [Saprospiraceae bacterium]
MTHQEFIKRYTFDIQSDRIGTGGYSTVYKAYDNFLDKVVAIKLAKVNNKDIDEKYRLKREMDLLTSMPKHPNIASYEDSNTFISFDGEYDFMVMQYYPLGNLNHFIRNKQLSQNQITKFLIQILEGLKFIHEQNIVHLDLNPSNILISDRNGEYIPKITDFGISQKLTDGRRIENEVFAGGTRGFSSPELFLPHRILTANADLWSFGVIAYWMFTKQMPRISNHLSMIQAEGHQQLVKDIDLDVNIPEIFKVLIRGMFGYTAGRKD